MKIKYTLLAIAILLTSLVFGQVTLESNAPAANRYVGFNNNSGIVLPIENRGFPEIGISSNGNMKFFINELATWNGLNGLSRTDVQRTTLGLQGETNLAWSMIHYSSGNISSSLKRDWFNVGTTYTANADLMYVGLMERPDSPSSSQNTKTDAVIAWGSDNSTESPDNFRLLFLRDGSSTDQGLETMRVTPWGYAGFGSEFTNDKQPLRNLVVQQYGSKPQFRIGHSLNPDVDLGINTDFETSSLGNLHIKPRKEGVDGTTALGFFSTEDTPFNTASIKTTLDVGGLTRIRLLPDSTPRALIIGYNIDDAENEYDDLFLGRLEMANDTCLVLASNGTWVDRCNNMGADLDWETDGTDVWTGTGANGYPDGKVGIGISGSSANAKLHVANSSLISFMNTSAISVEQSGSAPIFATGVNIEVSDGLAFNQGIYTLINDPNSEVNFGHRMDLGAATERNGGVQVNCGNATESNTGGNFLAITSSSLGDDTNKGVSGNACGAEVNYGVYGETCGTSNGNFAGYFYGDLHYTGSLTGPSDINLKTDIEDIINASELLASLSPKTYFFDQSIEQLNLPETQQFGLIAQDVEEVLPFLVESIRKPESINVEGEVTSEAFDYKGLKYQDFIALLIAGHQEQSDIFSEQQGLIQEQTDLIETMEETIAEQAAQMEALQTQMQDVLTQVQNMEIATSNCCTQKSGTVTQSPRSDENNEEMKLGQNVPNPFTNQTRIDFELPFDAQVILEITDGTGRPIQTLIDGQMSTGMHSTTWDGTGVASGMYYYTLYANGELLSKKMIKR